MTKHSKGDEMGIEGFILYACACSLCALIGYKQGKEAGWRKAEEENIARLRKMQKETRGINDRA